MPAIRSALFAALLACSLPALADTTFTYQGELTNSSVPATGNFDFRFILYSADLGGTQIGPIVTRSNVAVSQGVFTVPLDFGSQFGSEARFLEIAVKSSGAPSYTLLSPRQPLTPSTHALGLVLPYATNFNTASTGLSLVNAGDGDVIRADTSGTGFGIISMGSALGGGIYSSVGNGGSGSEHSAVTGYNTSSGSNQRYAAEFELTNSGSVRAAIYARTAGSGMAIDAEVNANTTATALYARTSSNQSSSYAGRFSGPVSVECAAANCNNAHALRVTGNTSVVGTLSKSAGSFRIDHPLDPAGKFLSHSFVESPDMKNLYDGVVTLDANGNAQVEMPAWFEALNRDFRYQLTGIGAASPNAYVAEEIKENRFVIAGGTPYAKISWQVTGTRHDAYARAHPIPVEEDKDAEQKGRYLTPEVFGKSRESAIHRDDAGVPAINPPASVQ
ncbi:MAG TPA: hypothetical protein VLF18_09295 [Tahibacter sp.]|uniref:hypothetical protein n=1 Tax=Tahibacter sp. TaxID=2056211 RepID=UPI002BBCF0CD|nr:hypothetical protein [Tahibacter sp.]HSX60381.1 hypothetical protein [Tahibacter sp.]